MNIFALSNTRLNYSVQAVYTSTKFTNKDKHGKMAVLTAVHVQMLLLDNTHAQDCEFS